MGDYDMNAYGRMLTDEARISAYVASIRAAIRPGDVVVDLGTGTGVMALLACQCGASRVYAIEPSEAIRLAQASAKANGFEDRIVFIRSFSTQVDLPEKGRVLISDLRGSTPCFSTHLADLIDARARLLAPDARWICQADTLYVGVADLPDRGEQFAVQWDGSRWGLDLSASIPFACNQVLRRTAKPGELLSAGQSWAQIRYPELVSPHVRGSAVLPIVRPGAARGLLLWFAAELFGGFGFSIAPGAPASVYQPIFLPWERAVDLRAGDTVEVQIAAVYSGHEYWWNWTSIIRREGQPAPVAAFGQSTLKGAILDPTTISRSAENFAPKLTLAGEEAQFILARIDGRATQAVLAAALRTRFPGHFSDDAAAMARVSQIRREFAQ